jgi:hypothetical protein
MSMLRSCLTLKTRSTPVHFDGNYNDEGGVSHPDYDTSAAHEEVSEDQDIDNGNIKEEVSFHRLCS